MLQRERIQRFHRFAKTFIRKETIFFSATHRVFQTNHGIAPPRGRNQAPFIKSRRDCTRKQTCPTPRRGINLTTMFITDTVLLQFIREWPRVRVHTVAWQLENGELSRLLADCLLLPAPSWSDNLSFPKLLRAAVIPEDDQTTITYTRTNTLYLSRV